MRSIFFLILIGFFTFTVNASPTLEQKIVGTYKGEIWSTGKYFGTTIFTLEGKNTINGSYTFQGDSIEEKGKLSKCKNKFNWSSFKNNRLVCTWEDSYGKGILDISFSNNYTSFDGEWWLDGSSRKYTWNGKKQL